MPGERPPFPPWLRELCYFGGLLLALAAFGYNLKSDQRSTREELARFTSDIAKVMTSLDKIEDRLPNKEADGLRLKQIEDKQKEDRAELDFEIAKINKWIEGTTRDLIKKGVID